MSGTQKMKVFCTDDYEGNEYLPAMPTKMILEYYLNSDECPISKVVAGDNNKGNLRILRDNLFTALRRSDRCAAGCGFGIFAPSGQGKTFIVKQFAKTLGIPFILVQSNTLSSTYDLFSLICETFRRWKFAGDYLCPNVYDSFPPIVEWYNEETKTNFTIPPCIVFFDEAHLIPKKLMKGGLLNAMERDDGIMSIKQPGINSDYKLVDCTRICWIAATTEKGLLFDAFANRLGTLIEWHPADEYELYHIVKMKVKEYIETECLPYGVEIEEPDEEFYRTVIKYSRVPRDAINFAIHALKRINTRLYLRWDVACREVANDLGIDECGFTKKQLDILTALGQRPIALSRIHYVAKCRTEQVEKFELPPLMSYDNGGPYVVSMPGRGLVITRAGLAILDKKGIAHRGDEITAEYFESKARSRRK